MIISSLFVGKLSPLTPTLILIDARMVRRSWHYGFADILCVFFTEFRLFRYLSCINRIFYILYYKNNFKNCWKDYFVIWMLMSFFFIFALNTSKRIRNITILIVFLMKKKYTGGWVPILRIKRFFCFPDQNATLSAGGGSSVGLVVHPRGEPGWYHRHFPQGVTQHPPGFMTINVDYWYIVFFELFVNFNHLLVPNNEAYIPSMKYILPYNLCALQNWNSVR